MIVPSRRLRDAPASATIAIADRVAALRARGEDIVDLSAGRAAEPTPSYVTEAAVRAMVGGDTHQTPAQGRPAFRKAAADKLARENGLIVDPEKHVLASLGAKQGLLLALLATIDSSDEVIIEDPGFVSYAPTVTLAGGRPARLALRPENRFRWTREELLGAVTPRTRAVLLCSPQNPTGVVHSESDLDVIASVARERDLLVIADETYERLTWQGRRHVSIATRPEMAERTVTLMGLTKSFAMGGWRIGYIVAPEELTAAMTQIQAHLTTCASSFAQTGAAAALGEPPRPEVEELWRDWEKRCEWAVSELAKLPCVSCAMPEGGYYAWIDLRARNESSALLAQKLLDEHRVALVPGSSFGPSGEGYMRMTCVQSWESLRVGMARLREGLS